MSMDPSGSIPPPSVEAPESAPDTEGPPLPGVPAGGLQDGAAPVMDEIPDDAKDTRGKHFRALFKNRWFLGITIGLAAITVGVLASQGLPAIGGAAAVVVLLLGLLVIWMMASSRAANDFYTAYCSGRGLGRVTGRSFLPPVTPLLQRGDNRYASEVFSGNLPGGLAGSLAFYTYEEESRDSKGNKQTTYYHFTVCMSNLPDTSAFIRDLALQRRSGFRFMDGAEDIFRKRQRVELESVTADKRFEIFIGEGDDMNRARQLFSPTFIVWLAEEAHDGVAFELVNGGLVVNIKGHKKTAHELDAFSEASAVIARRLIEEANE